MASVDLGLVAGAHQILAELFPHPNRTSRTWPLATGDFVTLPSTSRARVLLPASGSAAAMAVDHTQPPTGASRRLTRAVARTALNFGAGRIVPGLAVTRTRGADSIERVLESVLGCPVQIAIFLGPPRANRKPVLRVFDHAGALLAIAKIGLNPLTRSLATIEASALEELGAASTQALRTPDLLHFSEWRGHTVLVQSAFDLRSIPVTDNPRVRLSAMRELADCRGARVTSWRASSYLGRLEGRIAAIDSSVLIGPMHDVATRLRQAESILAFGAWHGDWTAWNMAIRENHALVWDWERFEGEVPFGFDALHYAFMPALKAAHKQEIAGLNLIQQAAAVLRPFDIPAEEAYRVAVAYLLDLACRYLCDRQSETGVLGGEVRTWLEPVLADARTRDISGKGDNRG